MSSAIIKRWETKFINLGTIRLGKKHSITFEATKDLSDDLISRIKTSCGCTTPYYDAKERKLFVKFKPQPMPVHLIGAGRYTTTKFVTVMYKDGTEDVLAFRATIIR